MDDLISRRALMKELSDFVRASNNSDFARTPTWNDAVSLVGSMPPAQPDLSGYSSRLWKAAYERGKADAQPDIIHCGECKHRDPEDKKCDCGHDILWQLPRDDEWYCADAERRTDEL